MQKESIILLAVAAVVIASIVGIFIGRPSRKKSRRAPFSSHASEPSGTGPKERIFVPRNRDKAEDHFPRNPTLAETGGLPPIKERQSSQS